MPSQICSASFFPLQKRDPFLTPALKKEEDSVREAAGTMDPLTPNRVAFLPGSRRCCLSVVMCLEMAVSCPLLVGNALPGRRCASGPSSRHLWKAGSVTTSTLPRSFSSVARFGGPKLTWLRQKASSPKPGSRGVPLAVGVGNSPPRLSLETCYVSLLHSQVKGESHAFLDRGLTH